jgi:glycerophosphoryl diester phosphodiesterase
MIHPEPEPRKLLVAHRGASAYAPEHTREAYVEALRQGADILEPDLQVTRDGVLIALHDLTLERTTNVRDRYPDRYRETPGPRGPVRSWLARDFTLAELRTLDAGAWFDDRFRGARIPTLAEVIEIARGRAGIFPETKAPEVYADHGLDMEDLLVRELRRQGLERPDAVPETPVLIQSFSAESLRILRTEHGLRLPLVLLVPESDPDGWTKKTGLERARSFADGIGPAKRLLLDLPDLAERAHALGMTVFPWTFRERDPGGFPSVSQEMAHFLYELGVDGLFTDNPDLFPRRREGLTP